MKATASAQQRHHQVRARLEWLKFSWSPRAPRTVHLVRLECRDYAKKTSNAAATTIRIAPINKMKGQ